MTGRKWIRRFGLAAAGGAAAALVFWFFCRLSPSAPIPSPEPVPVSVPDLPKRSASESSPIAETSVELVENSRWVRRDPQTKRVIEIGGFSKLLTPPEGASYWIVESPYLIRYEDRFVCRIDARRGRIQMEPGGQVPSNVELREQVTLEIRRPGADEDESATRIFLEDLTYNSERSEFFTEGPVRVVSQEADLKGKGLMLIYNPRLSRLEYLEVRNLDYLLIKEAAGLGTGSTAGNSDNQESGTAPASANGPQVDKPQARPADSEPLYYQCSLREDVVVQYGTRLVVAGADQVNIRQILWQNGSDRPERMASENPESMGQPVKTPTAATERKQQGTLADEPAAEPLKPAENEVLITCRGGIVIQVAPEEESAEKEKHVSTVEMIGQLQIERLGDDSKTRIPLAACSALRYVLAEDVLELFSDSGEKPIWLYLDRSGDKIRTLGRVFWDRRNHLARVDGPGQVFLDGDAEKTGEGRREVLFQGPMDLEFAQLPSDSLLSLKTANLAGGVEAVWEKEGIRSRSRQAFLVFEPRTSKPQVLDLSGDVQFETRSDGRSSRVEANRTVFHFDSSGQVKTASLNGRVRMVSEEQTVESDSADIAFEQTQEGRLVPAQVLLKGRSQIQSRSGESLPPARFEALRIDYDYLRGTAVAAGPVLFVFYTPADSTVSFLTEPIPVEITAEDSAEFLTDGRGTIEQVVFRGKVSAQWKAKTEREEMIRRFYGDRLTVDLDRNSQTGQRIRRVTMQDKQVLFESLHFADRKKVNHLRLTCRQFDYLGDENRIVAVGPGKMELNNQQVPASAESGGQAFSLQRPCFAYMEGFDRLSWRVSANEFSGEGTEGIYLNYWPFENGQLADQIIVQCVRVQAGFSNKGGGKNELDFLRADGGVEYREQKQDGRYLQGDVLTYEKQNGWVVIEGSPERPCKVNGVNVPMIQYHPLTGQMKTKLSPSPSSLSPQGAAR
ncbi:MAG TPA: hypothetical protein PK054_02460 [Anaerohalosphaeraceae bacterium]|nr:hypothetical protein [Anaerohalosphaeraceae bacterium]HOL87923.1 hypothetical protein [Anaerohalosphaeraceae bacterium]HPP55422.1 hypothetical protein [Anaerohalosphaeraceae bacterium]